MEGSAAPSLQLGLSADNHTHPLTSSSLLSKFPPSSAGLKPLLGGVTLPVAAEESGSLGIIHVSCTTPRY